ncbi:hypothetical protein NQ315_006799 [Exocentrus adspersus]|uniref:Uncharacterized protein n=1 Tax=Exocentrus adspersus TaxID=1586481 RepID=A0AAV8WCW4_9CUCU|nr:hypothetical protein NQ315_006799 [Exocentrus adspersus]
MLCFEIIRMYLLDFDDKQIYFCNIYLPFVFLTFPWKNRAMRMLTLAVIVELLILGRKTKTLL